MQSDAVVGDHTEADPRLESFLQFFLLEQDLVAFNLHDLFDSLAMYLIVPILILVAVEVELLELLLEHSLFLLGNLALLFFLQNFFCFHLFVAKDEVLWRVALVGR